MTRRWADARVRRTWLGSPTWAAGLVLPFLLGACSGAVPGTARPTITQAPTQTGAPAATPTAAPAATPTAVPVWTNYVVSDQRSARVLAVATDGTVYIVTFQANGQAQTDEKLVGLGPDGKPRTDWTAPQIPAGKVVQNAVADADGGLYIVIGSDFNSDAPVAKPVTLLHLDRAGAVIPGWPISIDAAGLSTVILAGNHLCFEWANDSSTRTIEQIESDGQRVTGWPLVLHSSALLAPIASDQGVVYVSTYTVSQSSGGAGSSFSASEITAYGPDGQPVTDWHAPATKAQRLTYVVPVKSGLLEVSESTMPNPAEAGDTLTWLNSDGTPTGVTAIAPKNGLSAGISVGPDGVPYVAWGYGEYNGADRSVVDALPGFMDAYGSDGKPVTGWPVQLSGWPTNDLSNPGSLPIGPDGTIWVLERANGFAVTVHALGPDGKARLSKPVSITADGFTTSRVGNNGVLYTTDRTGTTTTVMAISEDHA